MNIHYVSKLTRSTESWNRSSPNPPLDTLGTSRCSPHEHCRAWRPPSAPAHSIPVLESRPVRRALFSAQRILRTDSRFGAGHRSASLVPRDGLSWKSWSGKGHRSASVQGGEEQHPLPPGLGKSGAVQDPWLLVRGMSRSTGIRPEHLSREALRLGL